MDTLFGLPAHPLLVHIPIVLLPLAAAGVVVMMLRRQWYLRFRWVVLVLGAVGTLGAVLAASAGEQLEGRIRAVDGRDAAARWHHHAELGDTARTFALIFLVLLAAYVLVPWWLDRRSTDTDPSTDQPRSVGSARRGLQIAVSALALIGAAVSVTTIVQAGHSGSKSVWETYMKDKADGGG